MSLDVRVLGFAILISVIAVVSFGVLPALDGSRADLSQRARVSGGRASQGRTRSTLIAAQVTLSLVLLVGAGMLTRSFARILARQVFDSSHVALLRLRPRLVGYGPVQAQRFLHEVARELRRHPD